MTTRWIIIVSLIALFGLMATYQIWLWALLQWLARHNIVVTNVAEGTGKMIIKNKKAHRFITADADTDPDKDWNLAQEQEDQPKIKPVHSKLRTQQAKKHWLVDIIDREFLPGGMRWVGFKFMGYELYRYNFRWSELQSEEPQGDEDGYVSKRRLPNGQWVLVRAKKSIDYIFTKDSVYYFEVVDAETRGLTKEDPSGKPTLSVGMPIDLHGVATIRVVNPYLALMFIHDWLGSSLALLRPKIRSWVSQNLYEEVIGKREVAERAFDIFLSGADIPEEELAKARAEGRLGEGEEPKTIVDYLECSYGVRYKRIGFDDVVPPDAYMAAANQRAAAEQEKVRIQTMAEARASEMTIIAQAEANRITTVTAAIKSDPIALTVRSLEAFENVGANGNMIVVSDAPGQVLINAANKGAGKGPSKD